MNKGTLYALGAYLMWGVFPIYWKLLHEVSALEIIFHRILWSFIFVLGVILSRREGHLLSRAFAKPRTLFVFVCSAMLLGVNWLTYVWGVNAGYIVETSLGYFINPLVSVLLGVVFLRERLRPLQWLPVVLAAGGVIFLTLRYGALPWIALVLAFTFGMYGLVKKTSPLESLHSLAMETGILVLPAGLFLVYWEAVGTGSFLHSNGQVRLLMILSGLVTAIPLLLFGGGARRIPLSMIGILQYIAPTMQLLIGVWLYHEPFDQTRLVGFALIWLALLLYTLEGIWEHRRREKPWSLAREASVRDVPIER